jgi:hypothetical protein
MVLFSLFLSLLVLLRVMLVRVPDPLHLTRRCDHLIHREHARVILGFVQALHVALRRRGGYGLGFIPGGRCKLLLVP